MTTMGRFFRHSLALQAARLSVGLGGIAGMVLLPGLVAQSGFGVLAGYFLALLLLVWPMFFSETSAARLHGKPLPVAMSEGYAAGQIRLAWNVGLVAVMLALMLLASVAGLVAAWLLLLALLMARGGAVSVSDLLEMTTTVGPSLLCLGGFWLLVIAGPGRRLLTGLRASTARPISWFLPVGLLLLIVLGGLLQWRSEGSIPSASALTWSLEAFSDGVVFALLSALPGLGVIYAAYCRHSTTMAAGAVTRLPMLLVLGLALWTLAALGWANYFGLGQSGGEGLDGFARDLLFSERPPLAKVALCCVLVAVLVVAVRVFLEVPLHWLQWRLPGWAQLMAVLLAGGCFVLGALLAFALAQPLEEPLHQSMLGLLEAVRVVLIPLGALLLLGMLVRALPPAPMLWAQQMPLALGATIYLYWRYAVRLILVLVLLRETGVGALIVNFWTTVPDV